MSPPSEDEELFWRAEDQHQRLNELAGIPPEIREEPLRRDVRSLGHLLGNVIKEQEGDSLFQVVESGAVKLAINQTYPLREAARAHRDLEGRKTTGSTVLTV